jgi:hypothetical protein
LACAGAGWGDHLARTGSVEVALPKTSDPAVLTACANLIGALPADLEGDHRRGTTGTDKHVKQRAAAWGHPATTLRCGVKEPPAITVGGPDYTPDQNRYANIGDAAFLNWLIVEHRDSVTYVTTDRSVYVEVTVPFDGETQKQAASNALVDLAPVIVKNVPNKYGKFVDDPVE